MYINKIIDYLNELDDTNFSSASEIIKDTIENSGVIYFFGCGHSHMFGEEFFYRAGGLACVRPIFYPEIMLHEGAMQSSVNERKNDYINNFIDDITFNEHDCLITISTSGINPVPIDVSLHAKKYGIKVITISSFEYINKGKSRHKDDLYLSSVGDVNINNKVPFGDAILGDKIKYSPISTIIGMSIIHELFARAQECIDEDKLPVFRSGNISGSDEHNRQMVSLYEDRIPELTKNLEE